MIHCVIHIFFFLFFFSNISTIFLFLVDTGVFLFVGFLVSPVKLQFFELGKDCLSSSCTTSPASFLLLLDCSFLTKTQETAHLKTTFPPSWNKQGWQWSEVIWISSTSTIQELTHLFKMMTFTYQEKALQPKAGFLVCLSLCLATLQDMSAWHQFLLHRVKMGELSKTEEKCMIT